jgi:acetyl-CoA carboxylase beta subunit
MTILPAVPPASVSEGGARAAIAAVAAAFTEFDADLESTDPLAWPGYRSQLAGARARTGEPDAVVCGDARIGLVDVVLIAFDSGFMGGSIGVAGGQKIADAFARAVALRRPVVSLVASGGCRMQEGLRALAGMQRIAAAAERARAAGIAHVSVVRDAVTGGAWAALAAAADVVLALPGATVAFAGHRVRGASGSDAFTADGKLARGQVDQVVAEPDLRATLMLALELLTDGARRNPVAAPVPTALGRADLPHTGWAAVRRARASERPRATAYLDDYFDARLSLSGDRAGGRDAGMLCGLGRRDGRAIAFVAQTGTPNTPAGFRTAARVIRLADRLGLPILTLVDTPGAANDDDAEAAAIGPALADAFAAVAAARVPVTTLVIGEGGSGGALALASTEDLWMTPDSYFAVIAPEAAAAILKRGPADAPAIAGHLRLRPQDLVELGIVRGVAAGGTP